MKNFNNKSGFTLIEIIIVLIIVGILAAIALPNLYSHVNQSKGAEATSAFGAIKADIEACGQKNGNYNTCSLPTSDWGLQGNFTYGLSATCAGAINAIQTANGSKFAYCIAAMGGNTNDGATDYVTYLVSALGGAGVCVGNGRYAGVC